MTGPGTGELIDNLRAENKRLRDLLERVIDHVSIGPSPEEIRLAKDVFEELRRRRS